MMQETVESGTGTEAQIDGVAVAGKTGTTSDNKDRWFAGYTPSYTAVVWCGYDNPQEIVLSDENIDNPAAVLWNRVISAISTSADSSFDKPTDMIEVELCQDSGLLPTSWCTNDVRGDRTVTVLMAAEDVPTTYCNMHVEQELCCVNGVYHLATAACEEAGTVASYGMLNYARQFPIAGIVVADQQYCVGYLAKQSGYSEARADTLDPVNAACTIHEPEETETEVEEEEEEPDTEEEETADAFEYYVPRYDIYTPTEDTYDMPEETPEAITDEGTDTEEFGG